MESQFPHVQEQFLPPENQGWWPVVIANLTPEASARLGIQPEVVDETICVVKILVCFYQLLADGTMIGWWIWVQV